MTDETTPPAPAVPETPPVAQERPAPLDGGIHAPEAQAAPAWPGWAPALPEVAWPDELQPNRPPTFDETIAAIDVPAAHPSQYVMPNLTGGADVEVTGDMLTELQGIQSLLWHANLPKGEGEALMQVLANEAQRAPQEVDDAAFELQARETEGALRQVFGDRYDDLSGKVQALFRDLDAKTGGQFGDYLGDQAHVLLRPLPMSKLFHHVERLEHRRRSA